MSSSDVSNPNNEDFQILCVPEGEDVEPPIEELEALYQQLENGIIPELQWKCPGRRASSPLTKEEPDNKTPENVEKESSPVKNDFDFMDDVALPQMRVRTQTSGLKGSAKKKTANFAGVIDALKKHHLSQTQNKDGST